MCVCVLSGSQVCGAEERRPHHRLCRHPAGIPFGRADLPQRGRVQQVSGKENRRKGRCQDNACFLGGSHLLSVLSKRLYDQLLGGNLLRHYHIEIKCKKLLSMMQQQRKSRNKRSESQNNNKKKQAHDSKSRDLGNEKDNLVTFHCDK